ncbi:MAG: hypothetical protein V1822_03250 [Candidatus Micrarchaeota archaeon]
MQDENQAKKQEPETKGQAKKEAKAANGKSQEEESHAQAKKESQASNGKSQEEENSVYHMKNPGYEPKPKYHVQMTTGAKKILDEEQAKMLINMISHEFEQRPHLNIFKFEKVGLIVVKKGYGLLILTEEEKNTISKGS